MIAAARWIVVALAFAGIGSGLLAASNLVADPVYGLGFATEADMAAFTAGKPVRLSGVTPGTAAQSAGLRAGDAIRLAGPADVRTFAERRRANAVRIVSPGRVVALTPAPAPVPLETVLLLLQSTGMALLALVLALRGWHSLQARRLAFALVWETFTFLPDTNAVLLAVHRWIAPCVMSVGMWAAVAFACGWEATPPSLARLARRTAAVLAFVLLGSILYNELALPQRLGAYRLSLAVWSLMAALVVSGLAISVVRARGTERRRIAWISLTSTIAFVPWIVFQLDEMVAGGDGAVPMWVVATSAAFPIGLAYSILRRDIADLGFALNRAAVFAVTTALLVGLFGMLQWAADQALVHIVGRNDVFVQAAIALIVLYVVRGLRVQTDRLVTSAFFARRERRIAALRELARDVDAVSSADAIGRFLVDRLKTVAAIEAAVFVEDADGYARAAGTLASARVPVDAAPVVALRATLAAVRVAPGDGLGGAMIFPLAVRGRLRGGLVCAFPAGDDDFAPDESAALASLATRAAIARDDLLAETLRERVAELERENRLLSRLAGLESPAGATSEFATE